MRNLDTRSEDVLYSLISEFISSGHAVGSATVAKGLSSRVSPATVRSVMGDLEKCGLLTHKHTSGGRIPTDQGFRYYVDRLLSLEKLSDKEIKSIKTKYKGASYNISDIFKHTSKILSELSCFAGVVVSPIMSEITIKHIEFISLSRNRILGIFVGQDGLVENRIITTEDTLTHRDLEKINNYCSRAFYGLTLSGARNKIEKEVRAAKAEYDRLIALSLLLSQKMFAGMEEAELFVDGFGKVASIMDLLEERRPLIDLLNKSLESDRVSIFIGSESGYGEMSDCSVVSSSYKKDGKVLGTMGIIGPTRMDYSKVIPIVDCTAELMSDFLGGENIND